MASYQVPPKAMVDIVDFPAQPSCTIDPTSTKLCFMQVASLPSIADLAKPELRLGGVRINPDNFSPSRLNPCRKISVMDIRSGEMRDITGFPEEAKICRVKWSPCGEYLGALVVADEQVNLWRVHVAQAVAQQVGQVKVNFSLGLSYQWLKGSTHVLCSLVPDASTTPPTSSSVPSGPTVQENLGEKTPARTYADLLKCEDDEAKFEYYLTNQLGLVDMATGSITHLNKPGLTWRFSPSPSCEYVLVERLHRPFSYRVPAGRFPKTIEIWDKQGNVVHQLADLPVADNIPIGQDACRRGVRMADWRSDHDHMIVWAEAQDGGDPKKEVDVRDHVFCATPPFAQRRVLAHTTQRFYDIDWQSNQRALLCQIWRKTKRTKLFEIAPGSDADPGTPPPALRLLHDRSYEDRYSDPGDPFHQTHPVHGHDILYSLPESNGDILVMRGSGASSSGDRPFLDLWNVAADTSVRVWRCSPPHYERAAAVIPLLSSRSRVAVLTVRESVTDPPNFFVREFAVPLLSDSSAWKTMVGGAPPHTEDAVGVGRCDKELRLTDYPHPCPELLTVKKELITYTRDLDGVQMSGTLYLPPDYEPETSGPLPTLLWAYPREFKSAAAASQVQGSEYKFVRIHWASPLFWLTQGFAILDGPTMPIVGEGDVEPNESYVSQLVASAQAAVNELKRRKVCDVERVAIGGHSYGGFMTANLLAHAPGLFRAGIARSGAFNRTLTPFGFQSEDRTLWEAKDTYIAMSPLCHAEKVKDPILLIHGEADNNPGTHTIQSERFYEGLKGNGATARLVLLPHESHGYRARESILHMLYEQHQWLDKYVVHATPRDACDEV